jgi:hypothetical protein
MDDISAEEADPYTYHGFVLRSIIMVFELLSEPLYNYNRSYTFSWIYNYKYDNTSIIVSIVQVEWQLFYEIINNKSVWLLFDL